jgi:hypothetical protein
MTEAKYRILRVREQGGRRFDPEAAPNAQTAQQLVIQGFGRPEPVDRALNLV